MNHYSAWRYVLLVVLIAFGIIYAAPNLYGDDYAIQVAPKNALPVTSELSDSIKTALQQQAIPYLSITADKNSYLIRFKEASEQRSGQNALKGALGRTNTIALSLAPKTPAWLQALGAQPMKL